MPGGDREPGDGEESDPTARPRRVGAIGRLPLARTLLLVLVGLTLILALVASVGIGRLYGARQTYEDSLARSYEVEVGASRLLAAGVIEEAALNATGPSGPRARAAARRDYGKRVADVLRLAGDDPPSARLVRDSARSQAGARRLAVAVRRAPSSDDARSRLRAGVLAARAAGERLGSRQLTRRGDAREQARSATRDGLLVAAAAGGLALLAALALVAALVGSIRRPLESLIAATKKLARGDLSERVELSGPPELRELDAAFNSMAEGLEAAGARVEAERQKLAVTIESLGDALVVCDGEGVITATNPRAREIVPELAVGGGTDVAGSPLPASERARDAEVVAEHEGRTLGITAAPLADAEGTGGTVWTIRDVSERARLDRMKSDFVATASHELRTPLTSIRGFVELLGRSDALREREREFVDVILASTDRLVALVNDLLDVARLEAGTMEVHPRSCDLGGLVREVADHVGPRLAEATRHLKLDIPPGLPPALVDPVRLRQLLGNLIAHAEEQTIEEGRIVVSADDRGDELEVTVTDDGRGMSQEDADRVFDRFVRRSDGTGTGLGLAIVRALVDLHGGTIDVRSRVGEGTRFTVRLPVAT